METYRKSSYIAFMLSRMRPYNLTLYDDDTVEPVNMSGQLYGSRHLGWDKVRATSDIVAEFSDYYSTTCFRRRFTAGSAPAKIMICGFDNMQARTVFYNRWKTYVEALTEAEKKDCLFIDGRLAAEEFQVFCITGTDTFNMAKYESEWLFSDDEADATVCSYKQTTYMANMIGSIVVNLFTNFCANQCDPVIPRDLPFFTSYDASLMYFKTEV